MAIRFDSQWDAASTRSRQFWAFKRDCLAVALGRFGSNRNAACQIEHTYDLKQASRPCLHRCETLQWLDVVVVYKVNRLTRSLADFAKLVELFEANGVSFVAVTQQFNTTTSMGRLTLNVPFGDLKSLAFRRREGYCSSHLRRASDAKLQTEQS